MKTINRFRLLMISLIMLITAALSLSAQETKYAYLDFSFDGNKLLNVWDNPRTDSNNTGLDWDLEIGARDRHVGVYIFGGAFPSIDYMNYGTGVDLYLFPDSKGLDLSAGVYYSQVLRQDYNGNWGSFTAWISPRARVTYWWRMFGFNFTFKGQRRPELSKTVWELSGGLTIKFNK